MIGFIFASFIMLVFCGLIFGALKAIDSLDTSKD